MGDRARRPDACVAGVSEREEECGIEKHSYKMSGFSKKYTTTDLRSLAKDKQDKHPETPPPGPVLQPPKSKDSENALIGQRKTLHCSQWRDRGTESPSETAESGRETATSKRREERNINSEV